METKTAKEQLEEIVQRINDCVESLESKKDDLDVVEFTSKAKEIVETLETSELDLNSLLISTMMEMTTLFQGTLSEENQKLLEAYLLEEHKNNS